MTLREEVTSLSEDKRLISNPSVDKEKYFLNLFSRLLRAAAVKYEGDRSTSGQVAFFENDYFDSWKKKNIDPVIKENGKIAEKAWDKLKKIALERL